MLRFYQLILTFPRSVVATLVLVTLFFLWQMKDLRLSNSISELLPEDHAAVEQDLEVKYDFDSREMILIGLIKDSGIFNAPSLQKVQQISALLKHISLADDKDARNLEQWLPRLNPELASATRSLLQSGLTPAERTALSALLYRSQKDSTVDSRFVDQLELLKLKLSPISRVISLADVEDLQSSEWGLQIEPLMTKVPENAEEMARLLEKVYSNDMYVNGLVSADKKGTLILAELSFYYDEHLEIAHQVFKRLEEMIRPFRGPEQVYLAGVPMVNVYTSNYMGGDLIKLMPLVILLLSLIIYFSFRFISGVFIPLSIVLVALIWTLGFMALLGRPVTLITSAMPVMLIAVAIADGIHVISEYRMLSADGLGKNQAILKTMRQMTAPVIITSLTDIAGFSSLAISSLRSIRDFGLFTAFGVLTAMIFSLLVIPAGLKMLAPLKGRAARTNGENSRLSRGLLQLGRVSMSRRIWLYNLTGILLVISVLAIIHLPVGSTMVGYFKKTSRIYSSSEVINHYFGGTEVLNIVLDTGRNGDLKDPLILEGIADLQDTLESMDIVGYTTSISDYIKRINLVMNGNLPVFNRIPTDSQNVFAGDEPQTGASQLIAQYLLLYENAGGQDLQKLTDFDYRKANIVVQIRTDDTPRLRQVRQRAEDFVAARFGGRADVYYAGCSNLCIVADDLIIPSQLKSLGAALLVVLLLLAGLFRSLREGILGLIPLLLTVILVFTLMSLLRVHLDAVTALVASIVLGVGIDYSVHFIFRYKSLLKDGHQHSQAIGAVFQTSGRAILYNAAAVGFGFLVLMFSSFWPVIHIGWLVAANMFFAALLTLVYLPALLTSFPGRNNITDKKE